MGPNQPGPAHARVARAGLRTIAGVYDIDGILESQARAERPPVGLTAGEYKMFFLLASNVGRTVSNRAIYDELRYEGFVAGNGPNGYRANVRSAIKRIRKKFLILDPTFDEIEAFEGFGYAWRSGEASSGRVTQNETEANPPIGAVKCQMKM